MTARYKNDGLCHVVSSFWTAFLFAAGRCCGIWERSPVSTLGLLCLQFIIPEITELSSYESRLFKLVNHANKSLPQNIEYIVVFLAKTRPLRNAKCTFNYFLVSRLSTQIWLRRDCGQ